MTDNNFDPEILNELMEKQRQVHNSLELMKKYGAELAAAECNYQVAKAKKARELQDKGMSAAMITNVLKGDCSKELFARMNAEALYKASQEKINVLKIDIKVLSSQIEREWNG